MRNINKRLPSGSGAFIFASEQEHRSNNLVGKESMGLVLKLYLLSKHAVAFNPQFIVQIHKNSKAW